MGFAWFVAVIPITMLVGAMLVACGFILAACRRVDCRLSVTHFPRKLH
jgi:hypothetical protein